MIATMLSTGQVLKLGQASIYVYNAVSVVLHREIILNEIRSHSCLSYMVRRIRNPKTVFRTRAASASVRKLSYLVDSPDVVIQDLPLLCQFLKSSNELKHLDLDIPESAIRSVSEAFESFGIIRSTPNSMVASWHLSNPAFNQCSLALPKLQCLSGRSLMLMEKISKFRQLRGVLLEDCDTPEDVIEMLARVSPAESGSRMASFATSVVLGRHQELLRLTAYAYPNLGYLGLHRRAGDKFSSTPMSFVQVR